ncbi:MAG TPA: hypothetical protein VFA74_07390 [Terriglobales bacterium]|nr:hypothetical protein [Terriglobales bacterium]
MSFSQDTNKQNATTQQQDNSCIPATGSTPLFDLTAGMQTLEDLTDAVGWLRFCEWLLKE